MSKYHFDSYSLCACGAITLYSGSKSFSCEMENFNRFFGGLDLSKIEKLPQTIMCDHCVNHYGLDLCACGSGEPYETCDNGLDCCGKPMQSLSEGYTSVRADDAIGQARDDEIEESELYEPEDSRDETGFHTMLSMLDAAVDAENAAKAAGDSLVVYISDAIRNKPVDGVMTISTSPSIFTVNFSTIMKNRGRNLSAEFYSSAAQADIVKKVLSGKSVSRMLELISEMRQSKCATVGKTRYMLNESTLSVLNDFPDGVVSEPQPSEV